MIPTNSHEFSESKLVTSLIRDCTLKDSSRNHDVLLLQMNQRNDNSVFEEILSTIMRGIPESSVVVHKKNKAIAPYRVHGVSFVVIVSDIVEPVSSFEC
jgi:hypothetical protein